MSNLTYNPNVNIPYHSNQFTNYDSYENPRNDMNRNDFNRNDFSRNEFKRNNMDNNYRNDIDNNYDNNYRNNFENNNYDMPRSLPQIDSRGEYSRNQRPMNNKKAGFKNKSKINSKVNEKYENENESDSDVDKIKNNKLNWTLIIKKIFIFTALFLIMSSIKMDELVCKFIPYLSENQLVCMTTKGIILSLLIIIINILL